MHTHLRLREQNLAGPPAKFVRGATYDSALIKRLKLERLLNGHGEGKARVGLTPGWCMYILELSKPGSYIPAVCKQGNGESCASLVDSVQMVASTQSASALGESCWCQVRTSMGSCTCLSFRLCASSHSSICLNIR